MTDSEISAAPDPDQEPAQAVIAAFGGIRPMAHKLGVAVSTVQGWKERRTIPRSRHAEILVAAQAQGIALDPSLLAASDQTQAPTIEGEAATLAERSRPADPPAASEPLEDPPAEAAAAEPRQERRPEEEASPEQAAGPQAPPAGPPRPAPEPERQPQGPRPPARQMRPAPRRPVPSGPKPLTSTGHERALPISRCSTPRRRKVRPRRSRRRRASSSTRWP